MRFCLIPINQRCTEQNVSVFLSGVGALREMDQSVSAPSVLENLEDKMITFFYIMIPKIIVLCECCCFPGCTFLDSVYILKTFSLFNFFIRFYVILIKIPHRNTEILLVLQKQGSL